MEDIKIENVAGRLLTYDNDCSKEIGIRIGRATIVMFKNIWEKQKHKRDIKVACVILQRSIVYM